MAAGSFPVPAQRKAAGVSHTGGGENWQWRPGGSSQTDPFLTQTRLIWAADLKGYPPQGKSIFCGRELLLC